MEIWRIIFGEGKDLNSLQMCCRAVVVFLIALIYIRLSGRRSFALKTPLDNIITMLLGSILARAITGASPFIPVMVSCLFIVLFHRFLSWVISRNKAVIRVIEGDKIMVYNHGAFINENLNKALACEEDIMQGIRKSALTERLEKIDRVYMERNGEISVLKKKA